MSFTGSSLTGPLQDTTQVEKAQDGNTDAYAYNALQPRHIRLIRVIDFTNEISCEMKHFPLEVCPQYHALSYAWGSRSFSHRILFENTKHHLITEHLHQALANIVPLLSPSWLWIDQICINQNNSKDKAEQVALMGEIYARAVQTIVWLGPSYEKSDLAMSYVEGVAELIRNYDFDASMATLSPVELGFPHEDEQVWPAFQRLFQRPWWRRLWIVQEAIKAQDIVFVAGNQAASYGDFITLASAHEKFIQLVPNGTYKLGILAGLSKAFYGLRNDVLCTIEHFRSGRYASVDGEPKDDNVLQFTGNAITVLEFSRNQLCTEPVDRVYAILGLVGSHVRDKIKIDYRDENREQYWRTYLHFHRHLIDIFRDGGYFPTTLIYGRHTSNTSKSLPSWCPDLLNPSAISLPGAVSAGNVPSSASWKPNYRMIGPCNSNPGILHATGVRVDTIETLIPLWSAPTPLRFDKFTCGDATNVKLGMAPCFKLAETMKKSPQDLEWMYALFRTWVMNTGAFTADPYPTSTLGTDCLAFINRLTAIIDHHHHGKELDAGEVTEEASRYASAFFHYTRGRAFFVTEGGKLGMCDAAAAVGDEIAIWFNCAYPVVQRVLPGVGGCGIPSTSSGSAETMIDTTNSGAKSWLPGRFPGERREQQHRKLLGVCYVDGLMHGEIFSERDLGTEGYSNFLIV